jgi:hypothetical protein
MECEILVHRPEQGMEKRNEAIIEIVLKLGFVSDATGFPL